MLTRFTPWLRGLLLLGLLCTPALSLAQQPKPDSEGFVPDNRPAMAGGAQNGDESIPAGPLVASAYGFIWLAVLVFVGSVAVRARRLEGEIEALQQKLDAKLGR